MDRLEARGVVDRKVRQLRQLGYGELRRHVAEPTRRLLGGLIEVRDDSREQEYFARSGERYELETEVDWDDDEGGDLRVSVALWQLGRGRPIAQDNFIVAPDGSFVGE